MSETPTTSTVAEAAWRQRCASCGAAYSLDDAVATCRACDGLLDLEAPPPPPADVLRPLFDARSAVGAGPAASGVWRYRELLAPAGARHWVSYPEGNTPLVRQERVQRWVGVRELWLKHEGMNPTGSFKDRGMTVGTTQAVRVGATAVACASTGNTSASLAAYAALAGLPAIVFVPRGQVALGKLTQTLAYGARTLLVDGDFDACLTLAREASVRLGIYLLNSVNPFRLEGQKTIAFELLHQLGWRPPDWIALPAGNLGNTAALGRALFELRRAGLISTTPRILAVQASGAAPFAQSFEERFVRRHSVRADTVATAIRIGDPASYDRAVRAIRETDGVVLSVPDDAILDAKSILDAAGVGCEPASAASAAGAREAVRRGIVSGSDTVACILTGHVLKDPGILAWYHQEREPRPAGANRPIEVAPTLAAVEHVLRGA